MSRESWPARQARRGGKILAAGSVIEALSVQRNWNAQLEQHGVFVRWVQIVGREVARWAVPVTLRQNVLWLMVADAAHAQHLVYEKPILLQRINAALGAKKITDLRCQVGPLPAVTEPEEPDLSVSETAVPEQLVRDMTALVRDETTGRALARLRHLLGEIDR